MKLFTFAVANETAVGAQLTAGAAAWHMSDLFVNYLDFDRLAANPYSLQSLIAAYSGAELRALLDDCLAAAAAENETAHYQVAMADLELLAPLKPNNNVIAFGKNYAKHIAEMNSQRVLYVFTKSLTSVVGDKVTIPNSREVTAELDYEGELAIVIGKAAHQVSAADAHQYIFGYTIVNDISARNLQREHEEAFLAKSLPGSCPLGPVIVTADEIADPHNIQIVTKVNGQVRQDGNTQEMMMKIPEIIAELSKFITLEPGDVIATGTPSGVAAGMNDPAAFLQPGDEVTVTIEPIGTLTTRISE